MHYLRKVIYDRNLFAIEVALYETYAIYRENNFTKTVKIYASVVTQINTML